MNGTKQSRIIIVVILLGTFLFVVPASGATISVVPDFSRVSPNPYPLLPYAGNPVLTASMVTDRQAVNYVADPILFYDNNIWYMFFEVCTNSPYRTEIAFATSNDSFRWSYGQIVLSDAQFNFSFPQVYKVNDTYYMVPDSLGRGTERLYKALNFPYNWTFVSTLVSGKWFADPSLFFYSNQWWMFVSDVTNKNLYLYYSQNIESGWTAHPRNPIVLNDLSKARPAGRVTVYNNGTILRFAQNCSVIYGQYVRAFQVDTLTTTNYSEHEIAESPLLGPSSSGWNSVAMHTLGLWWTGTRWVASTDGYGRTAESIGIYIGPATSPPSGYVFSDGFDNAGLSQWSGSVGNISIQSAVTQAGSYAMQVGLPADNYVYKNLPVSYTDLFVRSYARFTALPGQWAGRALINLFDSSSSIRLSVFVVNYGGSYRWGLWTGTSLTYSAPINVNQWYCVEVEYNANTDSHRLYIDGNLVITTSDVRTEGISRVGVGSVSQAMGSGWSTGAVGYFDSVVVNTSYIGP